MTSTGPVPLDPSRSYPARPIIAASVAVFRNGRVLLGERVKPPGAGSYSLPGGLVELGETLEEAALRELTEETGVTAQITGFNGHVEVLARDNLGRVERHFVVASFIGEWVSGEGIASDETRTIVWANLADLETLPLTPGLKPLLEQAIASRHAGD
ncbi:NUDIX hydrolase [Lichenihabitans psoromatis]|uniref:NUDIX hydrolase n=1 Tax=Lichenihabitans psoromatis TaxID=2528642 RepID=UPI0010385593|nr:NUDIX hydrolase [Lichenihabitans psoromatis]